jgi:hypothetical protein
MTPNQHGKPDWPKPVTKSDTSRMEGIDELHLDQPRDHVVKQSAMIGR